MLVTLLVCLIVYLLWRRAIGPVTYWKDRGVPYLKPWPIVGNKLRWTFKRCTSAELFQDLYNAFPNERYIGVFDFRKPKLLIKDLDLLKRITTKNFDHFADRPLNIASDEPLFAKNLIVLKGKRWRDMRAALTPTFTSSKMRLIFSLVSDCATNLVSNLEKNESTDVDINDIATRFVNDTVASTAFGIQLNSLEDKDNEFYLIGRDLLEVKGSRFLKMLGFAIFPKVMKIFNITRFPESYSRFFADVVKRSIREREEKGTKRCDMIQILLDRRKKDTKEDTEENVNKFALPDGGLDKAGGVEQELLDEDIVAQAMLFFFAGFETTCALFSFMCYELAMNPDVQKRLQCEIDEFRHKIGGEIVYEKLLNLKYLDMVVSESLRLWCPFVHAQRTCVEDFVIRSVDGKTPLVLKTGIDIIIPILAIHTDPSYFPNPYKFDPDRFSDENKHKIIPFSYIPFGAGPRNCIASRYALLKAKIVIYHLLSKFDLVPTKKTKIPIVVSKTKITMAADGKVWIGFRSRNPTF